MILCFARLKKSMLVKLFISPKFFIIGECTRSQLPPILKANCMLLRQENEQSRIIFQEWGRKPVWKWGVHWESTMFTINWRKTLLSQSLFLNCDHIEDLNRAVCSLIKSSDYQNFEIIIVENNSKDPATFAGYEKLKQQDPRIQIVAWDKSFNYAAINNFGVGYAKGTLLLFFKQRYRATGKK